MSERERMLNEEPYNSRDQELLDLAHRARGLLSAYAATPSNDSAGRRRVLASLLGEIGDGVWIESPFFCDYGQHIRIGANSFVNVNCVFLDSAEISIGCNVLIGPGVQLLTVSHPVKAADRLVPASRQTPGQSPYNLFAKPISIGDNSWIGAGSIVLPGVTIGANTTIGAGSVVTSSVPADCLAFGQPCTVHRSLE